MTYNDLAELFKREGGDAQVCFSVISQNKILFGNNDTNKHIISFTNEEPIKWMKEVQEEPVSEDLSTEIDNLSKRYPEVSFAKLSRIALLVAKWQRQKDRKWLADNHKQIFNNGWSEGYEVGRDSMEEDMMKDAVDGVVHHFDGDDLAAIHYNDPKGASMCYYASTSGLEAGDKVKLIIIKQEEE